MDDLTSEKSQAIVAELTERIRLAEEADSQNRDHARDDLGFLSGDQWPEPIRRERDQDRRPYLTINRLPVFVEQVVGDFRRQRTTIHAVPKGRTSTKRLRSETGSDYTLAQIYDGILLDIQETPESRRAIHHAFQTMVACGYGAFTIGTRYLDDSSFDAELCIETIWNPFAVYADPIHVTEGMEKATWAALTVVMERDEVVRRWGEEAAAGLTQNAHGGEHWLRKDGLVVAEYWKRERTDRTVVLLSDGRTVAEEEFAPVADELAVAGIVPLRSRRVPHWKVTWYRVSGAGVLEGPVEWPGRYIPIVPCIGSVQPGRDMEPIVRGIVRNAKDPQRMYNYHRTATVEAIALAPRAPWLVEAKTIAPFKELWDNANVRNLPYLPFDSAEGSLPVPTRPNVPLPDASLMREAMMASDDIKAVTGIFDASLGARSNETSGRAILLRQQEGDTANFVYSDQMSRALEYAGRVLVDLIPKVYSGERLVRMKLANGAEDWVRVRQEVRDEQTGEIIDLIDLESERFDVRVVTGPAFQSQRSQAVEAMTEVFKAAPGLAEIGADVWLANMDWPGAEKLAQRIQKRLPPELRDDADSEQAQAAVQAQQQQQAQMLELEQAKLEAERLKAQADALAAQARMAEAAAKLKESEQIEDLVKRQVEELLSQMVANAQRGGYIGSE